MKIYSFNMFIMIILILLLLNTLMKNEVSHRFYILSILTVSVLWLREKRISVYNFFNF